ncbi:MAG: hypothetical protein A4E60_01119 [Syntrophorhabdus sp. PtaB.Bin047]|jgi:hypothetical protein|nr:MAG: hypothetical protein A4E60_01119 [Syntrophorhabdus sp. PtaB.Bin047]
MKVSILATLAIILALVWCGSAEAAEPNMKDGLWEITTKVEMKGMPANIPPTVTKQCLTKKESVPGQGKEKNPNCKITDQKVTGNTVTWAMVCKEKDGTVESKGSITYKGDAFDGTTTTLIKDKAHQAQQVSTKMTGKRLGPCDKK